MTEYWDLHNNNNAHEDNILAIVISFRNSFSSELNQSLWYLKKLEYKYIPLKLWNVYTNSNTNDRSISPKKKNLYFKTDLIRCIDNKTVLRGRFKFLDSLWTPLFKHLSYSCFSFNLLNWKAVLGVFDLHHLCVLLFTLDVV